MIRFPNQAFSKGNLIFCCTGSQENYFKSIGWQNIFYCNLKEKGHIGRTKNSKTKYEISIIILISKKLGYVRPVKQKIKLSSP